jgi:hypothetical protein
MFGGMVAFAFMNRKIIATFGTTVVLFLAF